MFDRSLSASWRITTAPHVYLAALGTLAKLLHDTGAPSQSPEMGAALGCHANRGDVHAAPAHDIPVHLFSKPNDADTVQTPQWQALPAEARRSVTKLMVSLMLGHVDGEGAAKREGADHDA